jgi:phosphoribosylaminoimidazole-succinocarboxamide synthase
VAADREKVVLETDLPGAISRRSGKVRDIYDYGDGLLMVATDRISAFDCILPTGIPDKGRVLTGLSVFWFERTRHILFNHLLSADVADFPSAVQDEAGMLRGRAMWVRKAETVPIECVVRGYLAGSGWREYAATGKIGDHDLPAGLQQADKLPRPIFTPAMKAESGHDENITRKQMAEIVGPELAEALEEVAIEVFSFASEYAATRGFLLCDTKFEFGAADGDLILIDEILTPDSSRYWDASSWEPGKQPEAFDKQYVRDYLETLDWDKTPPAPALSAEVVAETRRLYLSAYERITGAPLA